MSLIRSFLVLFNLLKIIYSDPVPGLTVNCTKNSKLCNPYDCISLYPFSWTNSGDNCQIVDCSLASTPYQNLTDDFCGSCPPDLSTTKTQIYSNIDGYYCVASTDSCSSSSRKINTWTDSDCQLCYSGSYFATTDKSKCVKSTATCGPQRESGTWTDADCLLCSPSSQYANIQQTKCVNSSTTCGSKRSSSYVWSDNECLLCYGDGYKAAQNLQSCLNCKATSKLTSKICSQCFGGNDGEQQYANSEGTACVVIDCSKTEGWTNQDCQICSPNSPLASNDKSICLNVEFGLVIILNYLLIFIYLLI